MHPRIRVASLVLGIALFRATTARAEDAPKLEYIVHESAVACPSESEFRAAVQGRLEGLELGRRAVFILHDLDDVPMPEIARELGIPLNTAYSRLRLARGELARAVRRLTSGGKP